MEADLKPASTTSKEPQAWQERLLPLMARMLIGLTVFFFVASFGQLFYLHTRIEKSPTIDVSGLLRTVGAQDQLSETERLAIQQANNAAALEVNVIERRHHQANVLLMARVWTNYLGFVTGMTIALVGAAFILGQLKEIEAEIKATVASNPLSFKTASPGLVLCFLGVALMITTIVTHHDIETRDLPVYFNPAHFTGKPEVP